uniref:Uncharacterized protein n=1 Tax=Panagrolaimus sp. JU765 TaxID=591449 RepID=A0AC34RT86_9BILA
MPIMDNPDGLSGIAGDRKFIDAYYVYRKSEEDLENIDHRRKNMKKREKTEVVCFKYYLEAMNHCFTKIVSYSDEEIKIHYLDYIRWNRDIIAGQLDYFKCIPHLQDYVSMINDFENTCQSILEKNFRLTTEEKSIAIQYVHAYERVQRYNNKHRESYKKALQHTGRLFINYNEAKDLVTRLKDVDVNLKKSVQETFELFKEYREFDDGCAKTNDELIAKALKLAHSRATENVLQTALRNIKETIEHIKHVMAERIAEAWEVGKLCLNPILNPIETGKNIIHAVCHPKETVKEIIRCANEKPWKFGVLIAVGVIGVAGITGALLVFSPLVAISLSGTTATAIGCGFGTITVATALTTMAASGRAAQVTEEAEQKIAFQEAKEAALIAKNEEEGRRVAQDILDNYIRREELRKAREETERAIRKQRLEKEKEEERKRQISSMSRQQLEMEESHLKDAAAEIETEVEKAQNRIKQGHGEFRLYVQDVRKIREGRNALDRQLGNIARKYEPIFQDDVMEDDDISDAEDTYFGWDTESQKTRNSTELPHNPAGKTLELTFSLREFSIVFILLVFSVCFFDFLTRKFLLN